MLPMLLRVLLLVVEVLSSILLIGVVLIQKSKGGGLSGAAFGGGMGESFLGARAGNVLTKITIVLTVIFLSNTLVLAFIYAGPEDASLMDRVSPPTAADIRPVEPAPEMPVAPPPAAGDPAAFGGDLPMEMTLPAQDAPGIAAELPAEPVVVPEEAVPEISEEPDAL